MFDQVHDPVGVGDPVEAARTCARVLAGEDRAGWSAAALSGRVVELSELANCFESELVRCVGQWDAQQAWAEDGALSAPSWLASRTAMARRAAVRLVRAARLAFRHGRTADALAAGVVSARAVETIATYALRHEDIYGDHEETLVEAAASLGEDALTFAMRTWRAAADDAADRADPFAAYERRHLTLSATFGGTDVAGFLEPVGAAWVVRALAAIDVPDPVGGLVAPRTRAQRHADALVELCRASLADRAAAGDPGDADDAGGRDGGGSGRGMPVVDLDAVVDLHRYPEFAPHDPVGALAALRHGSHLVGGQPVAQATIERLACDCSLTRMVFRGRCEVLDVGRSTRVLNRALRRALRRRDRHCQFPGCDRPPEWTDAHHLVHWIDGGTTTLDNLVLLCRRHHVLCHEGGWTLTRSRDGTITATPPDRHPPRPHGPGRGAPSHTRRPPPDYALAA